MYLIVDKINFSFLPMLLASATTNTMRPTNILVSQPVLGFPGKAQGGLSIWWPLNFDFTAKDLENLPRVH